MVRALALGTLSLALLQVSAFADDSRELLGRATAAFEAGELTEADRLYRELRRSEPSNPAGWYGGGLAAEATGAFADALQLLGRAAQLDPNQAAVHLAHGRVLLRSGAAPQALLAFERARTLDTSQADAYLFPAVLLRDSGRLVEAETLLRAGIERSRLRPELFDQLGLVLLSRQESQQALAVAEQGLAKFPSSARLRLVRGLALADLDGNRGEAISEIERAIAAGEGGAPARARLAELLLADEHLDEAIAHLEKAIEIDPSNPRAHYRLGLALEQAGRSEEASQALERFRMIRKERDQEQIRAKRLGQELNVALEHIQANRLAEALDSLDGILDEMPGHPRTLAVKAKVLFSLGRIEEASQVALEARIADPTKTEHHYLEGLFAYHLGNLERAGEALTRALAMDPDLAEAHEVAAVVALRQERPAKAIGHFERAIALGVDSEDLRRAYALALEAAQTDP